MIWSCDRSFNCVLRQGSNNRPTVDPHPRLDEHIGNNTIKLLENGCYLYRSSSSFLKTENGKKFLDRALQITYWRKKFHEVKLKYERKNVSETAF